MDGAVKTGQGSWKGMVGAVIAVYGAFKLVEGAVSKLISSTRQYQDFNAALKVSTRSAENAAVAYQAIEDFASSTPFSVQETTRAFINLVNLGLNPSEKALRAYGNVAASFKASGKTLDDVIQAVSDAARGENERLKEFGISASKHGNEISFTFQNVTKTVAFNAKAIEEYMIGIGEVNFAGAMSEQMKGLSGVMSNLGDSWDRLWVNISKQGPGTVIAQTFQLATTILEDFNARLASGQLQAELTTQGLAWGGYAEDAKSSLDAIKVYLAEALVDYAALWQGSESNAEDTFTHLPIYARAAFQKMVLDLITFDKRFELTFKAAAKNAKRELDYIGSLVGATFKYVKEMGSNPIYDISGYKRVIDTYKDDLDAIQTKKDDLADEAQRQLKEELDLNDNIASGVLEDLATEAEKRAGLYDQQKQQAAALRAQYDADATARKANTADRLAPFRVGGGDGTNAPVAGASGSAAAVAKATKDSQQALEQQLSSLERGLTAENQVVSSRYEERKQLILDNTQLTEEQKKAMVLQALSESLVTEDEAIRQGYDDRRAFILSSTLLTEQQKTELMTKLTKAREEALAAIERQNLEKRLDQASSFFGDIASIGSTFGKKGFEIAKAAAIAQATIDTYKAATGAYAALAGIPYIGPALGIAAAAAAIVAGTARIAQIKAQTYAGAYEHGGMIPGGKYGLVGERGPEYVKGPAIVTSAASSRDRSNGGIRTVTIQNHGQPVEASSGMNGDELMIILKPLLQENKAATKKEITGEIHRGGSPLSTRLETTYGLRRLGTT